MEKWTIKCSNSDSNGLLAEAECKWMCPRSIHYKDNDTRRQAWKMNFLNTWEPLVLGPELALERIPAPVCFNSFNISSWNFPPNTDSPPLPVPVGSPPCIMKSLIILQSQDTTTDGVWNEIGRLWSYLYVEVVFRRWCSWRRRGVAKK